jgi:hypothetical protein
MGRTVAVAEDGRPKWLSDGRRWTQLTAEMPPLAAARSMNLESADIRTVQRWARAAQFLDDQYPAYAESIPVGSAAVLALAKLHRLDPAAANALAKRVFSGSLTSVQITRQVTEAIERNERAKMLQNRSGSVWRSTFREIALRRILEEPQILGRAGTLVGFEENRRRVALEADLVAFFEEPNSEVAIVVRAPRDTAAKSAATTATQLLAEIGLMMLRYNDVVLVLPAQARANCEALIQLWENWTHPDVRHSRRLAVGLMDIESSTYRLMRVH